MQTLTNPTPLDLSRWVGRTVTAHNRIIDQDVTGELKEDVDGGGDVSYYVQVDETYAWTVDSARPVTLVECASCDGTGDNPFEDEPDSCSKCGGTGIDPRAGL